MDNSDESEAISRDNMNFAMPYHQTFDIFKECYGGYTGN
jgi:hypothetical protein